MQRARNDIAVGRLWKARDPLQGALVSQPADQTVLTLLGDVCFHMGDLPAAGRYWFLTERSGDDVREALDAMHEKYGRDPGVLREAVPVKAPLDAYPAAVQDRVAALEGRVERRGRRPRGNLLTADEPPREG